MSKQITIRCASCNVRLGVMEVRAIAGGRASLVTSFIQPRVLFYCLSCSKVNR